MTQNYRKIFRCSRCGSCESKINTTRNREPPPGTGYRLGPNLGPYFRVEKISSHGDSFFDPLNPLVAWQSMLAVGVRNDWNESMALKFEVGSAAWTFLTQHLLKGSPRRLAKLEFKGAEQLTLRIFNSDQATCKFVFNVPSLASPECSQVWVLKIEGLPGEEGYRLR